jgi:hypothetical protein
MLIEVMYCPKGKKLVRGQNTRWKELESGMISVEADCPDHPGEVLTKVRYPVDPTFDSIIDPNIGLELPDVPLPADPGTLKEPSNVFWEVFVKTVGAKLALIDRPRYIEIATLVWETKLTDTDKEDMFERFRRTGRIEEEKPRTATLVPEEMRINPEEPPLPQTRDELEKEWHRLNEAINAKSFIYDALLEDLSETDNEAAIQTQFDIAVVARIVGDEEYFSLIDRRTKLLAVFDPDEPETPATPT